MLTKDKVKGFFCGIFTMILLFTISYAEPIEKNIKVIYDDIKIYVDGNLIKSINKIQPIIYDKTAYIPIDMIGETLGKEVHWDAKTNSIYIGKENQEKINNEKFDVYLVDLKPFYFKGSEGSKSLPWKYDKDKDATGKSYTKALGFGLQAAINEKTPWVHSEYLLNQKYKRLKGNFCMHYLSRNVNKITAYLKVYGDDRLLYASSGMKGGVFPIDFDIDVTGVTKLKIVIESQTNLGTQDMVLGSKNKAVYGLGDVGLYK